MSDPHPATPLHGADAATLPPYRSLLARIVIVMLLLVALMSAVLFTALHLFVGRQLGALQQAQLSRQTQELGTFLANEKGHFARLAEFLAADSDLVHATLYHVVLRGENKALLADVQRLASTFQLARVAVRADPAPPLAAAGAHAAIAAVLDALQLPAGADGAAVEAVWARDVVWLVAAAPLHLPGHPGLRLWIARPLSGLFSTVAVPALAPRALPPDAPQTAAGILLRMRDAQGAPLALEIPVDDAARGAMRATTPVLAVLLAATAVVLAVALALFVRGELAPVHALTRAAAAVGRGDFGHVVPVQGQGEVARLARVFNNMLLDLQRLHALEQTARHEEQLAAIGRLATRVAHDINNPLTVIKNSVRLSQRRTDLDAGMTEELALIGHNCDRCIGIVEALLRFGRPIRLRRTQFELSELVRASVERFGRQRADARLSYVAPSAPLPMAGDEFQIEQLLVNLLDNAFSAAPRDTIAVEVRRSGTDARITVQDRGAGFSDEALDHLAEPFFTTKTQGTGLGLASCMAIARAHGGTLAVRNDDGAQVTVTLPLGPAAETAPGP